MNNETEILKQEAIALLRHLITLPSFSKDEWQTASEITKFLSGKGVQVTRVGNNVLALNKFFDSSKPTILLNSHHDTVRPNSNYTRDPFDGKIEDGKLYGLGSNDAGGCLVALMMTFLHYYENDSLQYNLAYAATAEEEISGAGGIENALKFLPPIDCAIVGEPTLMQMAIAEKGLVVLDCTAMGKAGHAARNEGENAIYKAVKDIEWISNHHFEKVSDLLGAVKMSVTVIETDNKAHNVVPAQCKFVIDVRVNEQYTLEEVVETIKDNINSDVSPRSLRIRSSIIPLQHPLVRSGISLGLTYYGSPTTSDKALMSFPALKIGPGDSARSHMADEYIYVEEIKNGIDIYIQVLSEIL
ncbi:M20 family metallo-hydrolase [Flavisolibacter ginsengisoli]|jgi:acetylornithine deacetylase|uniref:Acetylornithine deacetylase n=1 Tax=Flavisolibacter ginsengisoli DSM 18119 TaxID=1121884 RepID=A0A1M5DS61_9BACT|nr:M20 family metallo-hydrolase [Flavisolibacter ginsengisoli]SHF69823.1 acetylornithine deacetylase [Flavisolibacter ginsengisoli DSM 18119]